MDYEFDKRVGKNIREIRKAKELTQDELAARLQVLECDISRTAVAKIETGKRHIYLYELYAISKALGTGFEELLK